MLFWVILYHIYEVFNQYATIHTTKRNVHKKEGKGNVHYIFCNFKANILFEGGCRPRKYVSELLVILELVFGGGCETKKDVSVVINNQRKMYQRAVKLESAERVSVVCLCAAGTEGCGQRVHTTQATGAGDAGGSDEGTAAWGSLPVLWQRSLHASRDKVSSEYKKMWKLQEALHPAHSIPCEIDYDHDYVAKTLTHLVSISYAYDTYVQ